MAFVAGGGGGMMGGGAGGGHGGGGRGGGGHGGDDEEARKALVRSVGAKKRAARRYLVQNAPVPPSLHDYVPGGRYFNHLPPLVHAAPPPPAVHAQPLVHAEEEEIEAVPEHVYTRDDVEEAAYIAQAMAASEASVTDMRRREEEEIEAQMAVHRAHEEAERAAKRARVEDAVHLDDDE